MTTIEELLEAVFSVESPRGYTARTPAKMQELSEVQLSEVTCSSWLVSERVQLSVESQPVKRRIGGWCEMTASLGPSYLSVDRISARGAVTRGPKCGKLTNLPR
jgi:hypothetical protein